VENPLTDEVIRAELKQSDTQQFIPVEVCLLYFLEFLRKTRSFIYLNETYRDAVIHK